MTTRADRLRESLVWLAPALAAALLYLRCLGFWWSGDELLYLKNVILHSPAAYLFVPSVYRELSTGLFFPGVLLSFDLDHRLFGLAVAGYYAHQLLALALAAGLFGVVMRRFVAPAAAVAAGLLFVLGPTIPAVVAELMSRHYLEGLAAVLAATLSFLFFLERRRPAWLVAAAVLYLLAAICKEVFVPLPLVLVLLPASSFRDRLRSSWPFWTVLVVYAVWRQTMVAGAFGGYEASSERMGALGSRIALVGKQVAAVTFGPYGTAGGIVFSVLMLLGLLAVLRPRSLPLAAALILAVAGPLVPVAERFEPRLEVLPWLLVAVLAGAAIATVLQSGTLGRISAALGLLLMLALVVPANRRIWSDVETRAIRNRAEGEFFLACSVPGDVIRQPLADRSFYANLRWLRRDVLGKGDAGSVAYDDMFFCEDGHANVRLHGFDATRGALEPLTSNAGALCAVLRTRMRDAPLTVRLSYDEPFISWTFGPYEAGSYAIVFGEEFAVFPASRGGG